MLGRDTSTPYTQTAGTIKLRNFQVYTGGASSVTISAPLTTADITSSGTIQCVSLIQTSDQSIKQNVVDADLNTIQSVFDAVQVKTYERTDVSGQRIGFLANDLVSALDATGYDNIARLTYDTGNPLWGLDYARLTTILWAVCKNQQAELKALSARMDSLAPI